MGRFGLVRRVIVAACAVLLSVVGLTMVLLNRQPWPSVLAHRAARVIEQALPIRVEIKDARFVRPWQLALHDVTVSAKAETGLTDPIHIAQVQLRFSLWATLRGDPMAGLRTVYIHAPCVKLDYDRYQHWVQSQPSLTRSTSGTNSAPAHPTTSSQPDVRDEWPSVGVQVRRGQLELVGGSAPWPVSIDLNAHSDGQKLRIAHLRVSRGVGRATASGELLPTGIVRGQVHVTDWLVADLAAWYPKVRVEGRGSVSVSLAVGGTLSRPTLDGELHLEDARLQTPIWDEEATFPVQAATTRFSFSDGGWQIRSLELHTATGRVTGQGSVKGGRLGLTLSAQGLQLPRDIPQTAAWGVSGTVGFDGELSGSLERPLLSGRAAIGDGTLWGEAVSAARGLIRFSPERMQFDEVQIDSGAAHYDVEGVFSGLGKAAAPRLEVHLGSRRGRLEQLLSVLGWDVDAGGYLDGQMAFIGPLGHVITNGDVILTKAQAFGEQIDRVEGAFRFGEGYVRLDNVEAHIQGGTLRVDGRANLDGASMRMNISARSLPWHRVQAAQRFLRGSQGLVSGEGVLSGGLNDPVFSGRVSARDVQLGRATLTSIEGPITLRGGNLKTLGLTAVTAYGGTWWLAGGVSDLQQGQRLDLQVRVADESLSNLLSIGGYAIPAALVDGTVQGTVDLQGSLARPVARLKLTLGGGEVGMRGAAQVDLQIADRRVRIVRAGA